MPTSDTYAIIQVSGKQYRVAEGDTLKIARQEEGLTELTVTDVLLVKKGDTTMVGTPTVKGAEVVLTVTENKKDKKIRVATYKAKSRYRRTIGHRQPITLVAVKTIKA